MSNDQNGAALIEARREHFKQKTEAVKKPRDGQGVGTCGHVAGGTNAYLFNGYWNHDGEELFWLACCDDCARKANFDIVRVSIVEVVVFGEGS